MAVCEPQLSRELVDYVAAQSIRSLQLRMCDLRLTIRRRRRLCGFAPAHFGNTLGLASAAKISLWIKTQDEDGRARRQDELGSCARAADDASSRQRLVWCSG